MSVCSWGKFQIYNAKSWYAKLLMFETFVRFMSKQSLLMVTTSRMHSYQPRTRRKWLNTLLKMFQKITSWKRFMLTELFQNLNQENTTVCDYCDSLLNKLGANNWIVFLLTSKSILPVRAMWEPVFRFFDPSSLLRQLLVHLASIVTFLRLQYAELLSRLKPKVFQKEILEVLSLLEPTCTC